MSLFEQCDGIVSIIGRQAAANGSGLAKNWYLKFVQPELLLKFIIKSSLFVCLCSPGLIQILGAGVDPGVFNCHFFKRRVL